MNYGNKTELANKEIELLKAEVALLTARCEQYSQAYEYLQEQLLQLKRKVFGKSSERYLDPDNKQPSLLDESNTFANADVNSDQVAEVISQVAAHTRKQKAKVDKELPRRIEIIPLAEAEKQCDCGACKSIIRYESKEMIHYVPEELLILEQRREVAACAKCKDAGVVTANAPLQVLPKIKATNEFLAFLVTSKLEDRQPLYHLERRLSERHGIDVSRQTMAKWLIDLTKPLRPIYNLLKDQIIEYDVASCDATTLQVLKEPGRKAETKSYVYCMRGGGPGKSSTLYEYNAHENQQFIFDWFTGFNGYLHVDGDNVFNLIGRENAVIVNCNAHARRKFEPIAQTNKGRGIAKEALRYFKLLYKIEREAKDKQLNPQERYQLRQEKSKPILEEFNTWLDKIAPTVLPQSALGNAVKYCIKYRQGLMRFLDDGRLEIDNNLTEQAIKPLVIARKNFLFCDSIAGANALCLHFSLIQTAKLHGWDPYHYYRILLNALPHCKTVEQYEQLLPWNIFEHNVVLREYSTPVSQ